MTEIKNLDPVKSDEERIEEMASLARRSKSIAFKTERGGWRQYRLNAARRDLLAARLSGKPGAPQ